MNQASSLTVITISDKKYPSLLKEIPDAPKKIYCLGKLPDESPADGLKIAIVGTRKASNYGQSLAKEIAKKLTKLGIIIVSGLAMGIDTAAHEGALETKGKTIAVLANGLDKIYPAQNKNLAKKIIELGGAIISEYPPNTPAFPNQFLERNRIVSGLCLATIIIEAPERSGSLATARLAAEQGREVFVVPGAIHDPNYFGSHALIRDGARLITSVENILEDLNLKISDLQIPISNKKLTRKNITDKNQLRVIEAIKKAGEPLVIDKIIEITELEPQTANSAITFLTLEGMIKETKKGYSL